MYWKRVYGFDKYEVSSEGGIVRNRKTKKILNHIPHHSKYVVGLWRNKRQSFKLVEEIVMETFFREERKGRSIRFRDGDHTNYDVFNLYYGPHPKYKRVMDLSSGKVYESRKECAEVIGVTRNNLSDYFLCKKSTIKGHKLAEID